MPHVALDVSGVSYLLTVPHPVWDELEQGAKATLIVHTYVREDRLDLYGFHSPEQRSLFLALINITGIGPKIALELCSIPLSTLSRAVSHDDSEMLVAIKGIGRKTAEKLLVDLKSLFEKHPEWLSISSLGNEVHPANVDSDAIAALTSLGYDQHTVLHALKRLPVSLKKTEERVAAALRSL